MDEFRSPDALGILYAEDFSEDVPPPPAETTPEPPPLTQADIDAACTRAVRAAEAAWAHHAEERRTKALEAFAAGLAEARQAAELHAEWVADGIARTALSVLTGALPNLCRIHGDAEVQALLRQILPVLATQKRVVVRVHPGLVEPIREDLETLDGLLEQVELRPANLLPGDVRLAWDQGSLVRDTAAITTAIEESLVQLGLLDPPTPNQPATRSPALAR